LDACGFLNTLRFNYTCFLNESQRLVVAPPLGPEYRDVATALNSPLNTQWPAWRYLYLQAAKIKEIEARWRRPDTVVNVLSTDLETEMKDLPLHWLLQLNSMTGYSELCAVPFRLLPATGDKFATPADDITPGLLTMDSLVQARVIESTAGAKTNNLKGIKSCLNYYRAFLQVLFLYLLSFTVCV
jgi:hypothetical protein